MKFNNKYRSFKQIVNSFYNEELEAIDNTEEEYEILFSFDSKNTLKKKYI